MAPSAKNRRHRDPDRDEAHARAREELSTKRAQLEGPLPTLALAFEEAAPALELVLRYDADARRSLENAMRDLRALQVPRQAKAHKPADVIDVDPDIDQPAKAEQSTGRPRPRLRKKKE